jgi:hypothetical protein
MSTATRIAFIEALKQAEKTRTADYKGDGQRFYEALAEQWRSVHFDEKRGTGWAQAGSLGRIEFQESGNDPAVIVTVPALRFKADAETMVEVLEKLRKLVTSV